MLHLPIPLLILYELISWKLSKLPRSPIPLPSGVSGGNTEVSEEETRGEEEEGSTGSEEIE